MALNTSRSLRVPDAAGKVTSGKRGRPESLVRQFWQDIDSESVGPKCVFCDHRSITKTFRAPPATRHTLICKNAPDNVKARLRRVTNNKYSRRPPAPTDPSVVASVAAAAVAAAAGNAQQQQAAHHQVQQSVPQQQQVQHQLAQQSQSQPQHSPEPPPPPQQTHRSPSQQQHPQHQQQYAYKRPSAGPEQHHDQTAIQAMQSPRHITAGVVASMGVPSPNPMQTGGMDSVVPMRAALLNDRTRAVTAHGTVLSPGTDLLYANANSQRMLSHEDVGGQLDRANAALVAAVVESLFTGTHRKKDGAIPSPAEFRAALHDMKENARAKAKRQRDEARAHVNRLNSAISYLVGTRTTAPDQRNQGESDDTDDELQDDVVQVTNNRRTTTDWGAPYDRK